MGLRTLQPGAFIPSQRHAKSEVWFIHKGQGRATVEGVSSTVVPGMTVAVPPHAWHSLRNTGTGFLQWAWVSVPAGLEAFFRDVAKAGTAITPAAFQEMAQRHGIELQPEGAPAPPVAAGPKEHRRRHRGGRGRGRRSSGPRPAPQAPAQPPTQAAAPPSPPPPRKNTPPPSKRPPRRERPRRGHVKEVYMGGRWVTVSGEGPVIAPG